MLKTPIANFLGCNTFINMKGMNALRNQHRSPGVDGFHNSLDHKERATHFFEWDADP